MLRSRNEDTSIEDDYVSVEEPLEIAVSNGEKTLSLGVVFRTPGDDESLIYGMLSNEGLITSASQVSTIELTTESDATLPASRAMVRLSRSVILNTERFERVFPISAACGACGKSALESLGIDRGVPFHPEEGVRIEEGILKELPNRLYAAQHGFKATGGLHAASSFDSRGELREIAEDIGRHNAMDKLVGRLQRRRELNWDGSGVLFSGRVGYDLMQKAVVSGCPFVASIGAPSSIAVELATLFRMTLVGFLKEDRFNVYSGPHRIQNLKQV